MIDLIIIGDYKTGTSWWQRQILPEHPDICYLDDPAKHPNIVRLMHELVDSRDLDFSSDLIRKKLTVALKNIDCEGKTKVICREALSGKYPTTDNARNIAERLAAVFGKTKILIVIREQFSMLKSLYSEYIKTGGTLRISEFVYDPLVSAGLLERLKYHKIVDSYVKLFGIDNVYIGLYEEFKTNNTDFLNKVFNFIGRSDNYYQPNDNKKKINSSLTLFGANIQRLLNHFLRSDFNPRMPLIPLDKFIICFLSAKKKRNFRSYQKPINLQCTGLRRSICAALCN